MKIFPDKIFGACCGQKIPFNYQNEKNLIFIGNKKGTQKNL